MAPLLVFLLGTMTLKLRRENPTIESIISWACLIILSLGFICGVVALAGISRWGRRQVLVPAVVGLLLFGLIVFITIGAIQAQNELNQSRSQPRVAPSN
jgi:hypothetical protein